MLSFFSTLTWISMGLLVPCIALLLYFLARALLLLGQDWQQRLRDRDLIAELDVIEDRLVANDFREYKSRVAEFERKYSSPLAKHIRTVMDQKASRSFRERQLGDFAMYGESELSLPRLLIRLGPSLGLIGTLIPMGPALAGVGGWRYGKPYPEHAGCFFNNRAWHRHWQYRLHSVPVAQAAIRSGYASAGVRFSIRDGNRKK